MALLATVIFDGLHGAAAWSLVDQAVHRVVPARLDPNGFVAGARAWWRCGWRSCCSTSWPCAPAWR
jgi:hypothetical protein